jgi:hypothetical protein
VRGSVFTAAELEYVNGTYDFFAFDIYAVAFITSPPGGINACSKNSSHPAFSSCTTVLTGRNGWDVGLRSSSVGYVHIY